MKNSRLLPVFFVFACLLVLSGFYYQTKHSMQHTNQKEMSVNPVPSPDDVQWMKGPADLPPGAQLAVLQGDPTGKDLFTVRLKLPADYQIPPHSHPTEEAVTVLSGTFHVGMGDTFDKTNDKAFKTGGFGAMPAKMHHYAWTEGETIIQLHGKGPLVVNYVNKQDDPRNMSTSKNPKKE